MTAIEGAIAVLAAIGGAGGVVQLIKAIQAYRDGVRQRADEADERLVRRLEARVEALEAERRDDADYIRRLVMALGMAGIPIPARVKGPEEG